ncbi:hypothetical protein BGZ76_001473 [Entomortierella beljakovae]|nr:hypothetical protein BGZ76_001473 [Entomortierella beljakovae]
MAQPSNDLTYYVEYHSKINSITFSIQVPTTGLTCTIESQTIDIVPVIHHGQLESDSEVQPERLILPARVMPTRTTMDSASAQSSILMLKLTALPNVTMSSDSSLPNTNPISEFPSAPLPAAQLQGLESLACRCCGNTLLRFSDTALNGERYIQRVVDLPSEHWQELVDCWMCHEEDFSELREGDLGARRRQALVGGSYILIHGLDVELSAIVVENDAYPVDWTKGSKRKWRPIACSRCMHPVGDGWYQSKSERETDLEVLQVKFHKYMVDFIGKDEITGTSLTIPRQSFPAYVAAEMFESARHHATYRFILQDRLSGDDKMLLWMLNWDSSVIINQPRPREFPLAWDLSLLQDQHSSSNDLKSNTIRRGKKVMKVLFLKSVMVNDEDRKENRTTSKESALWDQWHGDPSVEKLQFHKGLLLGLLNMLEESTSSLPPTINVAASGIMGMEGMQLGYIFI